MYLARSINKCNVRVESNLSEVERSIHNAIATAVKENKSIVSQISKVYEIRGESMIISQQTIKSSNKRLIILKRELEQVQKVEH